MRVQGPVMPSVLRALASGGSAPPTTAGTNPIIIYIYKYTCFCPKSFIQRLFSGFFIFSKQFGTSKSWRSASTGMIWSDAARTGSHKVSTEHGITPENSNGCRSSSLTTKEGKVHITSQKKTSRGLIMDTPFGVLEGICSFDPGSRRVTRF